jgi:hypothetical protein
MPTGWAHVRPVMQWRGRKNTSGDQEARLVDARRRWYITQMIFT